MLEKILDFFFNFWWTVLLVVAAIILGVFLLLKDRSQDDPGRDSVPPKISEIRPIGDDIAYLLPVQDAFDDVELVALVPGLTSDYAHTSFVTFDQYGDIRFIVAFYPPSGSSMAVIVLHEFTVGDPRLINTVKHVGEITGKVYIWFAKADCWIFAPYKHNPSPPAGCAF